MSEYDILITQKTIVPKGESIFSETATIVTIDDESGGEFIRIKQNMETLNQGEIAISPGNEWDAIKQTIDDMIGRCRG